LATKIIGFVVNLFCGPPLLVRAVSKSAPDFTTVCLGVHDSMSEEKSAPDLFDLRFLPAWVKETPPKNRYADFAGEEKW
jgi:hypothetical protein